MIQSIKLKLLALACLAAFLLPDRIAEIDFHSEKPNPRLKYTDSLTHPTHVVEFEEDANGLLHIVTVQTRLDDWEDYPRGFE